MVPRKWVHVVPIKYTRDWDPAAPFAGLSPEERELAYEMVQAQKEADLDRALDHLRDKDPSYPPPVCHGHLRPWIPLPHRTRFHSFVPDYDDLKRDVLRGDYLDPKRGKTSRTLYRAVCEIAAGFACKRIEWLRAIEAENSVATKGEISRKRKASMSARAPPAKRLKGDWGVPTRCSCHVGTYGPRHFCGKMDEGGPPFEVWVGVKLSTAERQDTDRNIYIPFFHGK